MCSKKYKERTKFIKQLKIFFLNKLNNLSIFSNIFLEHV